jgi:hypothetical protein
MVMKWIAASPVDQLDVGIDVPPTVELELRSGTEQHVGKARDGDDAPSRIRWHRKLWAGNAYAGNADAVERAVAEAETAAGQPDAAEHRRKRNRRPIRLFAAMRSLQRP